MILFYTEKITPRIEYTAHLILTQILRVEVEFTTKQSVFKNSDLPKINYSNKKFGDEIYIKPHPIMHSKTITVHSTEPVYYNNEKYFFGSSGDSVLPFDLFAASFFLVTRYEEYTEPERDRYGRFQAEKSILSKNSLLNKPVVNIWANLLSEILKEKYPNLIFPERKFGFISTIDIDNAWAYKHKGFFRSTGAISKAVIKGNFVELANRIKVLSGIKKDPYDSYNYLDTVFNGNEKMVKFFFLLGDYGKLDKNVSHKNIHYRKLIGRISETYDTGIHPSFAAGSKKGPKKLKTEKKRLENITGSTITKSRQHFLKLDLPKTYRKLIKAGITEDYTMGYAEQPGFRAGICTPYYFYDLKKEKATNLLIVPFQVMDGTFRYYLEVSPEEALVEIKNIMHEIKNVGGTFVSVWHNETVNNYDFWEGYREIFEKMNELAFKWANE